MDPYERLVMSTMLNDFHTKLVRNMEMSLGERDRQFKAYWKLLDKFNAELLTLEDSDNPMEVPE